MEEVTLYNHNKIGSVNKPLIPNLIFKETVESLKAGETDFYLLVKEEYIFETFQKNLLLGLYQKLIK